MLEDQQASTGDVRRERFEDGDQACDVGPRWIAQNELEGFFGERPPTRLDGLSQDSRRHAEIGHVLSQHDEGGFCALDEGDGARTAGNRFEPEGARARERIENTARARARWDAEQGFPHAIGRWPGRVPRSRQPAGRAYRRNPHPKSYIFQAKRVAIRLAHEGSRPVAGAMPP